MAVLKWIPIISGIILPAVILPLHILVLWHFWHNYHFKVEKDFCTCSCWDTVFKGPYESGVGMYKHMYFNATANTFKMWQLVVFGIIGLYECVKHFITLIILHRIRYTMWMLFIFSIFSNYYAWWAYINYLNDDFYEQWNHQLFFTITELMSTITVVHLADTNNKITPKKVLCIAGIALLHIISSSIDQFFENVIRGKGYAHQIARDIGFMIPDAMLFITPLWLLKRTREESYHTTSLYKDHNLHKDVLIMLFGVSILFLICMSL